MNLLQIPFESKTNDEPGTFEGLAACYGSLDRGGDIIAPGAFKEIALTRSGHVRLLAGHDQRELVGKGRVADSEAGLKIRGMLNMDIGKARECYSLLKDSVLDGLSIGYDVLPGGAEIKGSTRHLTGLKLWEISLVTFPMHPGARVSSVKSLPFSTIRELESFARDVRQMSVREAKKWAATAWPLLTGGEAEPEQDYTGVITGLRNFSNSLKGILR